MINYIMEKKNIVVFTIDNTNKLIDAITNIKYVKNILPKWLCRFYCSKDLSKTVCNKLKKVGAQVVMIEDHKIKTNRLWIRFLKYLPLIDSEINYFIVRSIKSLISLKEVTTIKVWMKSKKNFHLLHDHQQHRSIILPNLWGGIGGVLSNNYFNLLNSFIRDHLENNTKNLKVTDEKKFLELYLWPIIQQSYIAFGTNVYLKRHYPLFKVNNYPNDHGGFCTDAQKFIGQTIIKSLLNQQFKIYYIEVSLGNKWIKTHIKNLIKNTNYKFTNNIDEADIIMHVSENLLIKFLNKYEFLDKIRNKKFLVLCPEPRLSITRKSIVKYHDINIYIMNGFTNNVFISPYRAINSILNVTNFDIKKMDSNKFHNKIVIIASVRHNLHNKIPEDLTKLRYDIAMQAYQRGIIHIYGSHWPRKVSRGKSRFHKNVFTIKLNILQGYYFNLCFENTNINNYVSEKIWHSIVSGCLPIYYGNPWIYKIFPKNSFIDYNDYDTIGSMLDAITNMKWYEFKKRFDKCYNVISHISKKDKQSQTIILKRNLLNKLNSIII